MKVESAEQFFKILQYYKSYYNEKQNDYTKMIETDNDIHIDSLYTKQIMNTPIQEFETYRNTPRASKDAV